MAPPAELLAFLEARAATLERVKGLAQRQLDWSPAPGRWSVGEVLDHLRRVDTTYRGEIAELFRLAESGRPPVLRRGFADIDASLFNLPKSWLPHLEVPFRLMSRLTPKPVLAFLAGARFIPIKNPVAATPERGLPGEELRRAAAASAQALADLFAAHPDLAYRSLRHEHPLFGSNDVLQLLEIETLHEHRHQAQIADLVADPSFPRDPRTAAPRAAAGPAASPEVSP
jgi:DinB superfamily